MNETVRSHAVVLALSFAFALAPVHAQPPLNPPLKNWPAPLYWAPTPAEAQQLRIDRRIAQPDASSLAQAAGIFTAPGPMTFIAMTPCRVMDTRGEPYSNLTGAFGPPNLTSGAARSAPLPSSSNCNIPSNAGAYSLNITAISDGGGLLSSFSVWPVGQAYPGVSTLNDSVPGGVVANTAIVVAGTSGAIQMVAVSTTNTDVLIDINGYYAAPTDASFNTAIGTSALVNNAGGAYNTAVGFQALQSNTVANSNTASGYSALQFNSTGGLNTASGTGAMQDNISGSSNTASGFSALYANTTGSNNIAIGTYAAEFVSGGNSNNIHIGSGGGTSDNAAIRIGDVGTQTSAYIAGIYGKTASSGIQVYINSGGQLGTTTSSRRFKEQITDMGDSTSKLLQLRPVSFFYKPEYDDGSHLLQYGLIAEEVAQVYPEMVVYGDDGQALTIRYQMLAPMLLNEVRKQNAQLHNQAEAIQLQQEQNRKLEDRLAALEALLPGQAAAAVPPADSH